MLCNSHDVILRSSMRFNVAERTSDSDLARFGILAQRIANAMLGTFLRGLISPISRFSRWVVHASI
jgi:hypothetical protein